MIKITWLMAAWLLMSLPNAFAMGATRQDFDLLVSQLEGVWLGESKADKAAAGFFAAGASVPGYLETHPVVDRHAAEVAFHSGTTVAKGFMYFDAEAQEIRLVWTDSDGTCSQERVEKADGGWKYTGKRTSSDGTSRDVHSFVSISQDHSTLRITSQVGDEELPTFEAKSFYANAKDSHETLARFGREMVGRWVRDILWVADWDGASGGQGAKAIGYEEWRWIAKGAVIECKSYAGEFTLTDLYCWDEESQTIVGTRTSSNGMWCSSKVKPRDDGSWAIVITGGSQADGAVFAGAVVYAPDEGGQIMRTSGTISLDGEELQPLEDVLYRVSP